MIHHDAPPSDPMAHVPEALRETQREHSGHLTKPHPLFPKGHDAKHDWLGWRSTSVRYARLEDTNCEPAHGVTEWDQRD